MIKRPHVMQDSIQDCGVACIEMICKFYNINIDRRYIQEETGYGMIGISLKAMEKFFSKVDANPEIVNISKINRLNKENREMINNSLPAIVFLEEEEIINHFVVIWHIGKKRILVSDPTHTKKEWINNKQIEKRAISYLFVEKPKNIFLNRSPKKVRFYGKFIKRNLKIFSLVMFFS
ncbi:peptidase C39, partial [Enterococcus faecalis]|nr:peptidase C39 [Enterococcus faecalis]EIW2163007.1 peptidase C39 [Enterococcus faecalis]